MGPCPSIKLGLTLEVLSLLGMGTEETGGVQQALQGKGGSKGRDRRHTMGTGVVVVGEAGRARGARRGGSCHQLMWALGTSCLPLIPGQGRQECWC